MVETIDTRALAISTYVEVMLLLIMAPAYYGGGMLWQKMHAKTM